MKRTGHFRLRSRTRLRWRTLKRGGKSEDLNQRVPLYILGQPLLRMEISYCGKRLPVSNRDGTDRGMEHPHQNRSGVDGSCGTGSWQDLKISIAAGFRERSRGGSCEVDGDRSGWNACNRSEAVETLATDSQHIEVCRIMCG